MSNAAVDPGPPRRPIARSSIVQRDEGWTALRNGPADAQARGCGAHAAGSARI